MRSTLSNLCVLVAWCCQSSASTVLLGLMRGWNKHSSVSKTDTGRDGTGRFAKAAVTPVVQAKENIAPGGSILPPIKRSREPVLCENRAKGLPAVISQSSSPVKKLLRSASSGCTATSTESREVGKLREGMVSMGVSGELTPLRPRRLDAELHQATMPTELTTGSCPRVGCGGYTFGEQAVCTACFVTNPSRQHIYQLGYIESKLDGALQFPCVCPI